MKTADRLLFPASARLSKTEESEGHAKWKLDIDNVSEESIERVKNIHNQTGRILHEFSPFEDFPGPEFANEYLWHDLNAVRNDHQWLWNRFWQHANKLKGQLFFVDLHDQAEASRPKLIKVEGLLDEEPSIDFDPEYVADFSGKVDWNEFV